DRPEELRQPALPRGGARGRRCVRESGGDPDRTGAHRRLSGGESPRRRPRDPGRGEEEPSLVEGGGVIGTRGAGGPAASGAATSADRRRSARSADLSNPV